MKRSIIIVDDNPLDLSYLDQLIQDLGQQWEVSHCFSSPFEALTHLKKQQPDLLFLDIEMDGMSGLQLLQEITPLGIPVIFVTNHDGFALKAFDLAAIDYLIKPVNVARLSTALDKAVQYQRDNFSLQLELLLQTLQAAGTQKNRIDRMIINSQHSIEVLDFNEIMWCEAKGPYSTFSLLDGKNVVSSKPLKYYEGLLEHHDFFRLHRSFMVNLNFIKGIDKIGLITKLTNGDTLPITPDRLSSLIDKFKATVKSFQI